VEAQKDHLIKALMIEFSITMILVRKSLESLALPPFCDRIRRLTTGKTKQTSKVKQESDGSYLAPISA
jgi:hypothetical protein